MLQMYYTGFTFELKTEKILGRGQALRQFAEAAGKKLFLRLTPVKNTIDKTGPNYS